jgi:hypothetical protein
MTTLPRTLSSIPVLKSWGFPPEQAKDAAVARWALTLPDQDLDDLVETFDDEMSKVLRGIPVHEEHEHCVCNEAVEAMNTLAEKRKAVKYEVYARRGMSAHQKMARMAAAMASPAPR